MPPVIFIRSVGTEKVEGLFTSPITVTLKLVNLILTIGSLTNWFSLVVIFQLLPL